MKSGQLRMSTKELDKILIIEKVRGKQIKQKTGAKILGISSRQLRRLIKAYDCQGAVGVQSKHQGRPSNNRLPLTLQEEVKKLTFECYSDFSPSFLSEKLVQEHKIKISKETLRQWMISWELWKANEYKKIKVHRMRDRRDCFGELIQIDGSHHAWFEDRGEKCCLLVFIDDATSRLVGLRFEKQETTVGYFRVARDYIKTYGRPVAFYSDKFSVFRICHGEADDSETQWGRAMRELDIEVICANSPQAKGRVERTNRTLQDRLVKEMRLRNISTIEEGNNYLPIFMKEWNKKFAVNPKSETDAHRQLLPERHILNLIFSIQIHRKVSKNFDITYENEIYQLKARDPDYRIRPTYLTIYCDLADKMTFMQCGQVLNYVRRSRPSRLPRTLDSKEIEARPEHAPKCSRNRKNPWQAYANVQLPTPSSRPKKAQVGTAS